MESYLSIHPKTKFMKTTKSTFDIKIEKLKKAGFKHTAVGMSSDKHAWLYCQIDETPIEEIENICSLQIKHRLEYLRGELRAERISYGELVELQALAPYIEAGDVELLEAAGIPEN
jgi:hypothetical protein